MESIWKVTTNNIDGRTVYGVYRVIDPKQPEHSGNREVYDYFESREKAEQSASELNGAVPVEELLRLIFFAMLKPVEHDSVVFEAVYGGGEDED